MKFSPFFYFFSLLFAAIAILLPAAGFTAEELSTPSILVYPDVYYSTDEILYLEGRAPSESAVEIHFQKSGSKPLRAVIVADSRGEWVFAQKMPLDAGNWEVRARALEGDLVSEWSHPRIVKSISTGIILGGVTIKFTFLLFVLLAIIIAGATLIVYYSRHIKRLRAQLHTDKTRRVLERSFDDVRREITEELDHLEQKLRNDKKLSREEADHREKLLRELREAEERIAERLEE